jgi:hypothetical protein
MEALTQLISELSGDTSFITSEAAIDALIDRALGRKFNRALLNRCLAADDAQDGEGEVAGPADPAVLVTSLRRRGSRRRD